MRNHHDIFHELNDILINYEQISVSRALSLTLSAHSCQLVGDPALTSLLLCTAFSKCHMPEPDILLRKMVENNIPLPWSNINPARKTSTLTTIKLRPTTGKKLDIRKLNGDFTEYEIPKAKKDKLLESEYFLLNLPNYHTEKLNGEGLTISQVYEYCYNRELKGIVDLFKSLRNIQSWLYEYKNDRNILEKIFHIWAGQSLESLESSEVNSFNAIDAIDNYFPKQFFDDTPDKLRLFHLYHGFKISALYTYRNDIRESDYNSIASFIFALFEEIIGNKLIFTEDTAFYIQQLKFLYLHYTKEDDAYNVSDPRLALRMLTTKAFDISDHDKGRALLKALQTEDVELISSVRTSTEASTALLLLQMDPTCAILKTENRAAQSAILSFAFN